ncbi:MAG: sulfate adenylyltransferase [Arcobacteraceae bacterium]|nr:sulfate adenylyltransferase [Arcobacteraceae bacterium]
MANRQLYIDKEAVVTLGLLQDGLLYPATSVMGEAESKEVNKTKKYNGITYPFALILAPKGKRNEQILTTLKPNEILDFVCEGEICGNIASKEVFKIDKDERVEAIYGTNNLDYPGVKDTYRRLGNYAISGEININNRETKKYKEIVSSHIKKTKASRVSSMMVAGKPFHRVHERLIRTALVKCDLMILFILKPYGDDDVLSYDTRYKTVKYFCDNYLPKDRVLLIPLDNTYIFGGFNTLILNAIVAKNFGCNELVIGQNYAGLGAIYCDGSFTSVVDNIQDIGISIDIMSEFVYCDKCSTLVSTNACPHGRHHHINYHSSSILKLLKMGIIPPALFMRKEISSIILSDLFPQRLEELNKIHQHLSSRSELLDDFNSKDFYESLMDLYQTSSLT